jgi:hypothetical protein
MAATLKAITKPSRWYRSCRPRSIAAAYTEATMNPPTRYAATSMWAASSGIASLKMTCTGSTSTTLPEESRVKPDGAFIQAFAATTDTAPKIPASTIGTPVQKCAQGRIRRHP